jgi:ubiquilin
MNNPMFAGMMSQMLSNPQMLDQVIATNPDLARVITPEVRARMQSPEFQQMISNPQMIQQMLQMQQMMSGKIKS